MKEAFQQVYQKTQLCRKQTQKIFMFFVLSLSAVSFISGCGDSSLEQDPTKGYEVLNSAEVPTPHTEKVLPSLNQLYFISTVGDLTFVQGEKNKVSFLTRLAFVDLKGVKYRIDVKEGPINLGAKFAREGNGVWSLSWQPAKGTLNANENFRKIKLVLHFVLEPSSSVAAKAEFAGHAIENEYTLILQKESSQPIIEDKIEIDPGATIGANQTAKIRFVVAAKALDKPESLIVNLYSGPRELSSEIAQLDAMEGVRGVRPRLKSKLGTDAQGRQRFQYEVVFNAKPFMDFAQEEIKKQPVIKRKVQNKEIKEIEALLTIEGFNSYNHEASAHKNLILKVTIPESNPGNEVPQ